MVEPTFEKDSAESSGSGSSNRTTYMIVAGFVLALILLLALNWN